MPRAEFLELLLADEVTRRDGSSAARRAAGAGLGRGGMVGPDPLLPVAGWISEIRPDEGFTHWHPLPVQPTVDPTRITEAERATGSAGIVGAQRCQWNRGESAALPASRDSSRRRLQEVSCASQA